MKRIIAKQNHYKSLLRACKRHPEFSEGKAQLQQMIVELEAREGRISDILSDICRPVSIFYSVKQQAELEMNREMLRFTSLGELVAIHNHDDTMHYVMKTYQSQLYKVSAYRLYLNALNVADILKQVDTNLTGPDFNKKQLPAFRKQAEDFGLQLTTLADQLLRRKVLKKELAELIASTNLFLRDGLDYAVNFTREKYPDFYREYMLVRQPHQRKRRTKKETQPELPEAINTITALKPVLTENPEPKHLVIDIGSNNLIPTPDSTPIVNEKEVNTGFENEIPHDYLEQISELIYPVWMKSAKNGNIPDN